MINQYAWQRATRTEAFYNLRDALTQGGFEIRRQSADTYYIFNRQGICLGFAQPSHNRLFAYGMNGPFKFHLYYNEEGQFMNNNISLKNIKRNSL